LLVSLIRQAYPLKLDNSKVNLAQQPFDSGLLGFFLINIENHFTQNHNPYKGYSHEPTYNYQGRLSNDPGHGLHVQLVAELQCARTIFDIISILRNALRSRYPNDASARCQQQF